ncbi:hypothetical protein Tco_0024983 [Tanacetum coccineum]
MSAKGLESKVMRECCFVVERDAWLRGLIGLVVDLEDVRKLMMGNAGCETTCGDVVVSLMQGFGEFALSTLDVLQTFGFFLQMGFTLILATLDGLDVGLLGDVIGEDDVMMMVEDVFIEEERFKFRKMNI